ncbi:MAG TPA: hypothetical protein VLY24_06010 [Bryobacteraceae bacterium]|nr:hypothetical protein [Bryobacteraceae bacterium]
MEKVNLVLKFQMAGKAGCYLRGAARIKVDGRGGLTLYDTDTAVAEKIDLSKLQSLSIRFLDGTCQAA